ncbi:hypothetical protein AK830_g9849 [Neonectria ditissima]|uniref:Apple domain-containing protein n=1 Tax=Neonectria ditissima TaxID=78410 RepID=A0A0P7B8D5_9HYPO|nr:hypothetical protein AK830_g9849 [Neonectria ditissima]
MMQQSDSEGLQVYGAEAPEAISYYSPTKDDTFLEPLPQRQAPLPFGLGIWTFGILIGVVTAITVGGAVGGGCGAALANCHNSDSSPAKPAETTSCPALDSNITSSNNDSSPYVQRAATSIDLVQLKCPDSFQTPTTFKSNRGYDFTWYCGVNAPAGELGSRGGPIADVAPIIAYSLDDCLNACGTMIERDTKEQTGAKCRSVVFNAEMKAIVKELGGNCFLKNDTKAGGSGWSFEEGETLVYAEAENTDQDS